MAALRPAGALARGLHVPVRTGRPRPTALPALPLGVAIFYVAAGLAMAAAARAGVTPSPWAMGITFLVGQLYAAAVLRRSPEEVMG